MFLKQQPVLHFLVIFESKVLRLAFVLPFYLDRVEPHEHILLFVLALVSFAKQILLHVYLSYILIANIKDVVLKDI
ncbi:hypothetical protein DCAR_0100950 [Daucus carota subsp. sativus]|uniref:Uncharacterized protein n=1 Tax=Daucus carota subsp. sativus TaxID=79200 RepID=A0A175YAF0_DAUCS|nr:hypothetical protein DCAR_0100950 [Daucus carota subsp. sativus]